MSWITCCALSSFSGIGIWAKNSVLNKQKAVTQRILPSGLVLENDYRLLVELPSMQIDFSGRLAFDENYIKKDNSRKFWHRVGTGLAIGVAFIEGIVAAN